MTDGIAGQRALVTGASRGIGRATAWALARAGAEVGLVARGQEQLRATAAEITAETGVRTAAIVADVGVQADRERLVEAAVQEFGGIDLFVSNATNLDVYAEGSVESKLWEAHFEVDLLGAVRLTELLAPGMRDGGGGAIVYVSSIAGKIGQGFDHGYVALKAALIAATKTLAVSLVRDGVRLNGVAPGAIYEPGGDWDRMQKENPTILDEKAAEIPAGRLGRPDDVADAIVYLLSPGARWIVGHTLVVDGGQYPGIV